MDTQDFLAALTHVGKYARFIPELGRREVYLETVDRVKQMHRDYYKDKNIDPLIDEAFSFVEQQLILPSMRSMQFAGEPILRNHARLFNCSFLGIDDVLAWKEVPFLLLSGCGVGYSVQKKDVEKLPLVRGTRRKRKIHFVEDTIEGWAEAFYVLALSYFFHKQEVVFNFSRVRKEGTPLKVSGGKAPGPKKLAVALERVRKVFDGAVGRKLTPLECHDMMCHIADCVIAGGIRRSAMISLFSDDDQEMLTCKSGEWWLKNAQRARANNSVVLYRPTLTRDSFFNIWDIIKRSNAGEPGFFITNSWLYGTNPCAEVALLYMQFCNLCTIAAGQIKTREQFLRACRLASIIGTLQSGYTKFKSLRKDWQRNCEADSLLGISMTGIADNPDLYTPELLEEGAKIVVETNKEVAAIIGVAPSARTTLGKPDGTSSLEVRCASGIHSRHSPFYARRMRFGKNENIAKFLINTMHQRFIEDDAFDPTKIVLTVPVKSPVGSITRLDESAVGLAKRAMIQNQHWIKPGHITGENMHNQSVTISIKDHEWEEVGEYLWENKELFTGVSVLPYDGGTYAQAPFEEITEDQYNDMMSDFPDWVDFYSFREDGDFTNLSDQSACAGGACEVV